MKNSLITEYTLDFLTRKSSTKISLVDQRQNTISSISSYSVSATIDNVNYTGYGQEKNKDQASFIALMELVERFIVDKYEVGRYFQKRIFSRKYYKIQKDNSVVQKIFSRKPLSTNGVAVHTIKSKAIDGAINELIERHTILKSLCYGIVPSKIDASELTSELPKNIAIDIYGWIGPMERKVIAIRCKKNGKKVYGFGCNKKLNTAISKACLEIFPRACLLSKYSKKTDPLLVLNKNFLFHWYENTEWTDKYFNSAVLGKELPRVDQGITAKDIWVSEYIINNEELRKTGIKAFVAVSDKMQALFTGEWCEEKLNNQAINLTGPLPPDLHVIG